jgi:hypothetical protein
VSRLPEDVEERTIWPPDGVTCREHPFWARRDFQLPSGPGDPGAAHSPDVHAPPQDPHRRLLPFRQARRGEHPPFPGSAMPVFGAFPWERSWKDERRGEHYREHELPGRIMPWIKFVEAQLGAYLLEF